MNFSSGNFQINTNILITNTLVLNINASFLEDRVKREKLLKEIISLKLSKTFLMNAFKKKRIILNNGNIRQRKRLNTNRVF